MTVVRDDLDDALDAFKASMQWCDDTPEDTKMLVLGNLNGLIGEIRRRRAKEQKCRYCEGHFAHDKDGICPTLKNAHLFRQNRTEQSDGRAALVSIRNMAKRMFDETPIKENPALVGFAGDIYQESDAALGGLVKSADTGRLECPAETHAGSNPASSNSSVPLSGRFPTEDDAFRYATEIGLRGDVRERFISGAVWAWSFAGRPSQTEQASDRKPTMRPAQWHEAIGMLKTCLSDPATTHEDALFSAVEDFFDWSEVYPK